MTRKFTDEIRESFLSKRKDAEQYADHVEHEIVMHLDGGVPQDFQHRVHMATQFAVSKLKQIVDAIDPGSAHEFDRNCEFDFTLDEKTGMATLSVAYPNPRMAEILRNGVQEMIEREFGAEVSFVSDLTQETSRLM